MNALHSLFVVVVFLASVMIAPLLAVLFNASSKSDLDQNEFDRR